MRTKRSGRYMQVLADFESRHIRTMKNRKSAKILRVLPPYMAFHFAGPSGYIGHSHTASTSLKNSFISSQRTHSTSTRNGAILKNGLAGSFPTWQVCGKDRRDTQSAPS